MIDEKKIISSMETSLILIENMYRWCKCKVIDKETKSSYSCCVNPRSFIDKIYLSFFPFETKKSVYLICMVHVIYTKGSDESQVADLTLPALTVHVKWSALDEYTLQKVNGNNDNDLNVFKCLVIVTGYNNVHEAKGHCKIQRWISIKVALMRRWAYMICAKVKIEITVQFVNNVFSFVLK